MMPIFSLKPWSPLIQCTLIALAGGLIGGTATVQGMRSHSHGTTHHPAWTSPNEFAAMDDDRSAAFTSGCGSCSERDLGYRWAMLASVRQSSQCPDDSRDFRRGCLDFAGGS